jgi:hypothetical protein
MTHFRFVALTAAVASGLFFGMLFLLEVGRRLGLREAAKHGGNARSGVGIVDSVVYSLLGLLIGFSFSGAADRFDRRRERIGDEVHAIGVGWEAIDVLPPRSQPPIRAGFKHYLDALYAADTVEVEPTDKFLEAAEVADARHGVWTQAVAAVTVPSGEAARLVLLPALREMFVAAERERLGRRIHPPAIIYVMLGLTALAAALLGGYAFASTPTRNWTYMIGVAAAVSISTYVIVDLEYPRIGIVRVDPLEQVLADLHANLR